MPSTLEQLSPTRVKLTITMTFDELKPTLDQAYKDIASQVASSPALSPMTASSRPSSMPSAPTL